MLRRAAFLLCLLVFAATLFAGPVTVAYFTDGNAVSTGPNAPIVANGFAPVQITDITTFDFATANIVMIDESDNGSPSSGLQGRFTDLTNYVSGGGRLVVHDRNVAQGTPTLPPALLGSTLLTTSFSGNIDIETPGTTVTNGPFGTITNSTLDGGNSSDHGYATLATRPAGAVAILNNGTAGQIVAYSFAFGSGTVYYSTIPLDFYLGGSGNNPPRDQVNTIYAPNVLAYVSGQAAAIPEPATISLLGAGLLALGLFGRRRR